MGLPSEECHHTKHFLIMRDGDGQRRAFHKGRIGEFFPAGVVGDVVNPNHLLFTHRQPSDTALDGARCQADFLLFIGLFARQDAVCNAPIAVEQKDTATRCARDRTSHIEHIMQCRFQRWALACHASNFHQIAEEFALRT